MKKRTLTLIVIKLCENLHVCMEEQIRLRAEAEQNRLSAALHATEHAQLWAALRNDNKQSPRTYTSAFLAGLAPDRGSHS